MSEKHQFVYRNTGPLTLTADCESCTRLRAELSNARAQLAAERREMELIQKKLLSISIELKNGQSGLGPIATSVLSACLKSLSTPPADAAKGDCNDAE